MDTERQAATPEEAAAEAKATTWERARREIVEALRDLETALDENDPALALRDVASVLLELAAAEPGEHGRLWDDRGCRNLAVRLEQHADEIEENS